MVMIEFGLLVLVATLLAILAGMHVGVAMILVPSVGALLFLGPSYLTPIIPAGTGIEGAAAVPMFAFAGFLLAVSGIAQDVFNLMSGQLRRTRGGTGIASMLSAVLVTASGTNAVSASASPVGTAPIIEMVRVGYPVSFAVAVQAAGSALSKLVPPSLILIVWAFFTETSISRLFLASVIPAAVIAASFCSIVILKAPLQSVHTGGDESMGSLDDAEVSLAEGAKLLPIVALAALTLGGIYAGFFTPSEAGAICALGALAIALIRRRLKWRTFWFALVESGKFSAAMLFLLIAGATYARVMNASGFVEGVRSTGISAWGFLAACWIALLFVGRIVDSVSASLVVLPLALPVAALQGMDPAYLSVMTLIPIGIGAMTRSFDISLRVLGTDSDASAATKAELVKGVLPFAGCMFVVLVLLVLFPSLSLWPTSLL